MGIRSVHLKGKGDRKSQKLSRPLRQPPAPFFPLLYVAVSEELGPQTGLEIKGGGGPLGGLAAADPVGPIDKEPPHLEAAPFLLGMTLFTCLLRQALDSFLT